LQSYGSVKFNIPEVLQLYEKTELKPDTLTWEQQDVLEKCKGVSDLHIEGLARTGKTLVALQILLESLTASR